MPETVIIPPGLLKAVEQQRCVFMIGAGASMGEGLPSAPELADQLIADIQPYVRDRGMIAQLERHRNDLSKLATVYSDVAGSDGRRRIVDRIEAAERDAAGEFHTQLALIPQIRNVITTNWDQLIERAYDVNDRVVVHKSSDFRDASPERTTIIKMHGCRTSPDEMVLAFDDYATFTQKRSAFADEVRSLVRKYMIVCIGYSMQDSNFAQLIAAALPSGSNSLQSHYFVLPNNELFAQSQFGPYGFEQIKSDGRDFIRTLKERLEEITFRPDTARIAVTVSRALDADEPSVVRNPFEMFDTESLANDNPERFVEYFIEPLDYARITGKSNVVVEGHRGSGKTMVFRYLSMLHDSSRPKPLPFFGFYVKLNNAFFDPYPAVSTDVDSWRLRFHHYFNLVIATGILRNLKVASAKGLFQLSAEDASQLVSRCRERLFRLQPGSFGDTLEELHDQLIGETDQLRNSASYGDYCTGQDCVKRFLELLASAIPALKNKRWVLLLDEWDNLRTDQQRAVVMRLHDRDEPLRYKIVVKTLCFENQDFYGNSPDLTHDYEPVPIDHCLFEDSTKRKYFEFLRLVSAKRLELARANIKSIEELLPTSTKEPKFGYDYSGFENFAMLSSGLVREFLELCKDSLYQSQPELAVRQAPLKPIAPQWQNHVAKIHAAIHYNNHRNCTCSDEVQNLIFVMGSTFHAIDRATRKQAEHRKPLTIVVHDHINLQSEDKDLLLEAVKKRLLQLPDRPMQPRNPEEGPQQKYTLHRLICPLYKLDVHERYNVSISASDVHLIRTEPQRVIKSLTKNFDQRTVVKHLPKKPRDFPLFSSIELEDHDE